ncbi:MULTISPECIES: hypothetical protein [Rhodococcus]|uniref:hypothetical protein n=1 Tax=Rhodococcus TaxID=1827 RepID=UPI001FC9322D|nr:MULTISPECIES: hypothetical protein [Rhodococcus]WML63008.1 hypothetical protein QNA09_24795 [Rhodococcus sp. AH-ZY2]
MDKHDYPSQMLRCSIFELNGGLRDVITPAPHIQTVYPTERLSNHAVGRAVDIREIAGRPVPGPATIGDLS